VHERAGAPGADRRARDATPADAGSAGHAVGTGAGAPLAPSLRARLAGALPVAALPAAVLLAIWLLVAPRTPDLAGQVYRASLFRSLGFAVWDEHWYGGHALPGYSLLFPPLGALVGVWALGAIAALTSVVLFERIVVRAYGARARWAAALFALAAVGDVWIGRVAFALGVTFALAAMLALMHRRVALAVVLSLGCAAASPVAGLLLALGALTATLAERSGRPLALLGAPAAGLALALAVLFGEGGWEPFPLRSFIATAIVLLAFLWAVPREERLLRIGGVVYLLACVLCLAVHSPMGSNVERYGVLLAGPLLLCAVLSRRIPAGASRGASRAGALAVGVALAASTVWVVWGPVRETRAVAGSAATRASYYAPLERYLQSLPEGPVRIEVPLTRSHWEAALLAPSVSLARGWEKQLETRYDRPLLSHVLSTAAYLGWLRSQAVGYVALPDAPLDPSSAKEGAMVRAGLPYLRETFRSSHWRVFRVLGALPLLSGPGRLAALGHDGFEIAADRPGSFLVRVRYTPYWTLTAGAGCVGSAPGGWTEVQLRDAGRARVAARFSLARALGSGDTCGRTPS
jgi:hypothetical protein